MTFEEADAQFDNLKAAIVKEEADVTTFIAAVKSQGGVVTQAQLDALGQKFTDTAAMVSNFDLATTAPPVVPAPLPTP